MPNRQPMSLPDGGLLPDGEVGFPALGFLQDIKSGFYRIAAGVFALAVSGVKLLEFRRGSASDNMLILPATTHLIENRVGSVITTAGPATWTTAQLMTGLIVRDPNGAGRTDTTPTAAEIIAALNLQTDGDCFTVHVANIADAAEALTIAGGTGVSVVASTGLAAAGTQVSTLSQGEAGTLLFYRSGAAAIIVYPLGM